MQKTPAYRIILLFYSAFVNSKKIVICTTINELIKNEDIHTIDFETCMKISVDVLNTVC